MKKIKLLLFITLTLLVNTVVAQLKKANEYYDGYDYPKAIREYKKVLKNGNNPEALGKLANAYRVTKNYQQAEVYYARLIKQSSPNPIDHLYYGMILKNNDKIDEAKEQFQIYANAAPNDKRGEELLKSIDDIKLWNTKTKQFDVNTVPVINSSVSDFSPVVFNKKLVFVSERSKDLVNYNTYNWNEHPYLNVYTTEITGTSTFSNKIKLFSTRINTTYHDGPVCFNAEQNTMYITRVNYIVNKKDKNFVNPAGIYISSLKGNSWSSVKPFKYNNEKYSVAHPSISSDGQWLFFASDMPGGQGGMDIYFCKKEGDDWGQPKNAGTDINTSGDEVFPYIRKDGMLYFSSDGHSGFGGLDIFSASKNNDMYSDVKNLGAPLNSPTDDFGMVFTDDNNAKGYFSSDRTGGKGADDIYSFISLDKSIKVAGKILLSKKIDDPAKNAEIMLLDNNGKVVKVATTDNSGLFKFDNLDPDIRYMLKVDETFSDKKKYYLADEKDRLVRVSGVNDKGGKFVFDNLPADPNAPPELGDDDNLTIAGNLLYGENPSMPLANTKVSLINDKGEVIEVATTNAFGAFVFTNIPPDKNFIVKVDENDTKLAVNTKIVITNKSGKEIQTTIAGNGGNFKFAFISADQNTLKLMSVDDSELRFDLKGNLMSENKAPIAATTVNIVNERGDVIATTKTDANGGFQFSNLAADQQVLFTLNDNDPKLKPYNKIYLTDAKGKIVKEFAREKGKFKFNVLPSDQKTLGTLYVDDPWLKVLQLKNEVKKDSLTIVENIYYNYDEYKILPEAQKTLDKVINIMKNDPQLVIELSSHTDSRASNDYNMKLSQNRAKAAVDYMLSGGVNKMRISGKGYGETRLINKCADGVECSEEEHAKNRRTEFKIVSKQK